MRDWAIRVHNTRIASRYRFLAVTTRLTNRSIDLWTFIADPGWPIRPEPLNGHMVRRFAVRVIVIVMRSASMSPGPMVIW